MKLNVRLILILATAIAAVTFVVAFNEVRTEKQGLRSDFARRAETLAEGFQETVEPYVRSGATPQLMRSMERFGNREHLIGIAVLDASGNPIAQTSEFNGMLDQTFSVFESAKSENRSLGTFKNTGMSEQYIYALPLHRNSGEDSMLVLVFDASEINARSLQIWRDALWQVVVQVLLILLIMFFVIRTTITQPVTRVVQYLRDLRTGKTASPPEKIEDSFLGTLSTEAATLGQNLVEARATAKVEARLREAGDLRWTAERLRASIRRRLRGSSLFIVSNREPYQHVRDNGGIEVRVPASGLVTALEPILCACDGTWIAHGSADADSEVVDKKDHLRVPPDHPLYTLRRIWLTKEEEEGHYVGFSNEGIWPLCHIAHTRPIFGSADWEQYQRVNEKFASATLDEIEQAEHPFVLIQDYHFALLPKLIKAKRPDARVAIFWHIPWPNPQAFGICPWGRELLDGLLGADLVSFHIQADCNNFLETVDQSLESRIEWDRFSVNRSSHITLVRPHPISVSSREPYPEAGRDTAAVRTRSEILADLGPDVLFLGVGVDRVDYTKGILERFHAIESFFGKSPHYRGRFSFVQFGAPSRSQIKRYREFLAEVESEAERINVSLRTESWNPIVLFNSHHGHEEIEPFYKAADFCFVSSLHDGMNLVAKEFVAARDDGDGVLILSQFTGASHELRDALLINPYDTNQMAETVRRALEMPLEERRARMKNMRRVVRDHNIYRWAAELISEMSEIRLDAPELAETR